MNETKALENEPELKNGTSTDTKPSLTEIGANTANLVRKTDGLAENANEARPEGQAPIKRKVGAPFGNMNNFKHGAFTRQLHKAKSGRLRGKAKRMAAETLACVLHDQGDTNGLSTTFQFYCQRFARRVARLHVMEKAIDDILQQNPRAKTAPNVLSKLNGYLQPLEDACLRDAVVIGFKVANGSGDPLTDYVQATYSNGKGDSNGATETDAVTTKGDSDDAD